jgi:hypothetical protein
MNVEEGEENIEDIIESILREAEAEEMMTAES